MNENEIQEVEDTLRQIESELETVGQRVCPIRNGGATWQAINRAIGEVQRAIHNTYMMRD